MKTVSIPECEKLTGLKFDLLSMAKSVLIVNADRQVMATGIQDDDLIIVSIRDRDGKVLDRFNVRSEQ
jgi:hypothetical protein